MIASNICKDLYEWILNGERQGTIHSIFKNSVNILSEENRLISVIAPNKPIGPNGIKVKENIFFDYIEIGEKGEFTRSSFISDKLNIYYGDCILWDKKAKIPQEKDNPDNLLSKLQLMGEFILNHGNKNGIFTVLQSLPEEFNYTHDILDINYPLSRSDLFIKDRFIEFIKSFRDSKLEEINIKSKKIIGFGAGLTPSMDDFLSGLMIANIYVNDFLGKDLENPYKINEEIIKDIKNKTTLVSEEMLGTSSKGEANEDIRSLMTSLIARSSMEEIYRLSMKVANLGSSSGTDILCGIYIGSLILLSKMKGEFTWD